MQKNNRRKELFRLKLASENEWLIGSVFYHEGGQNYFTGNKNARGYYVLVNRETITGGIRSYELFNGGDRKSVV